MSSSKLSVTSAKGLTQWAQQRPLASVPRRSEGPFRRRFHARARPAVNGSDEETTVKEVVVPETDVVKFNQEEMKAYKIPNGRFFSVLGLVLAGGFRGFSGINVAGYSFNFTKEPDDGTTYRPFKPLGYPNIIESSSKISTFKRPEQPIEIYEFQACPFCQKVREAVSILDLDVMFYPTPVGGPRHRPRLKELGGKISSPYMVDPNTGTSMYESDDIIRYLYRTYGDDKVPFTFRLGPLTTFTCGITSLIRFGKGRTYRPAKYPDQPLTFWAYEASPFSRFVRETLVELELPFLQVCCARGSPKRELLRERVGVFQAPYLEDPNTGVAMFESTEIVKYLEETYALKS